SKKLAVFERDFGLRRRETEPLEARARKHERIPIVLRELAQPSWHIAAKIYNLDVRTFPGELMFPSHTTARDRRAFPERSQTARLFCNQHVIHWCTRKNRCDLRAWVRFARQIFRTVHCNINISGEKGSLDFSGKQSFSPLAQVSSFRVGFVTAGPNDFRFDRKIRPFFAQCLFHPPRLGTRQFAATRSDYDLNHSDNVASVFCRGKPLASLVTIPRFAAEFLPTLYARYSAFCNLIYGKS